MGCDIHMYCEELITLDGNKTWVNRDNWRLNEYYDLYPDEEPQYRVEGLQWRRNYRMFSALCGVRSQYDNFTKISEPRGIPEDSCKVIKEESDQWGCDGHSHSYVTLREVREYVAKNEPIACSGMVSEDQAYDLDDNGVIPNSWCGWSSCGTLVQRSWSINDPKCLDSLLEDMVGRFLCECQDINEMSDEELDKYRIVFWFDN